MSLRLRLAEAASVASTWVLRTVFRRPAANFPGKIGLRLDPELVADLRSRIQKGTVVVVGTNGKTTVTNLLADAFEAAGNTVVCNRTGANLESGVATALLHTETADWGVLESDELWLAKVLPELQPDYLVLLNLFRDQLDRMGEIDRTQQAIVDALTASPGTTLIYNTDDPFCQAVATRVSNRLVCFGVDEDLGLTQNTVADSGMCQQCESLLVYEWHQYGQLGSYHCPRCGFSRAVPTYAATDVVSTANSTSFSIRHGETQIAATVPFPGTYMLYNALAMYAAADCCGIAPSQIDNALRTFVPHNGRLQRYELAGRHILLNLAKNPAGLNQNLRIIIGDPSPKAVAFFINDKEADGHDISWLWDVDFQELAGVDGLDVYAGGLRRNDLQVRLKYAGIEAELIDDADDFLARACASNASTDMHLYLIANYTALPSVKAQLDALGEIPQHAKQPARSHAIDTPLCCDESLHIVHLYPDLLNLYGDGGNVTILANRAHHRGIDVTVTQVKHGQGFDLSEADIVFLGGGPDREQRLASHDLLEHAGILRGYIEDDGVLLAICGGYQILGREWLLGNENIAGLDVIGITTGRAPGGSRNRLVGNIALECPMARMPVIGYENHAGRTYLDSTCEPFGRIIDGCGNGNNDTDGADGVRYRNVIGTYLHGPLLAKNPEVADFLIARAIERRAAKQGRSVASLPPLDNSMECAANEVMRTRMGIKR